MQGYLWNGGCIAHNNNILRASRALIFEGAKKENKRRQNKYMIQSSMYINTHAPQVGSMEQNVGFNWILAKETEILYIAVDCCRWSVSSEISLIMRGRWINLKH